MSMVNSIFVYIYTYTHTTACFNGFSWSAWRPFHLGGLARSSQCAVKLQRTSHPFLFCSVRPNHRIELMTIICRHLLWAKQTQLLCSLLSYNCHWVKPASQTPQHQRENKHAHYTVRKTQTGTALRHWSYHGRQALADMFQAGGLPVISMRWCWQSWQCAVHWHSKRTWLTGPQRFETSPPSQLWNAAASQHVAMTLIMVFVYAACDEMAKVLDAQTSNGWQQSVCLPRFRQAPSVPRPSCSSSQQTTQPGPG